MDSCYVPWFFTMGVPSFGNPRIEAYLQLPAAYRSLSRPSSAPDAKAFTLCSCSLELPSSTPIIKISAVLVLTWIAWVSYKTWIIASQQKGFSFLLVLLRLADFSADKIVQRFNVSWIFVNSALAEFCYPLIGKTWSLVLFRNRDSSLSSLSVFSYSIFRFIRFSMSMKLSLHELQHISFRTCD